MAKLKPVVEKIADVEEAYRGLYIEKDGKFHLDADIEDVGALKAAIERVKREREELRKKLSGYGELEPERVAELLKMQEDAEVKKATAAGEFEKLKTQLVEKHDKEVKTLKTELEQAVGFIREVVAENAARAAITELKGEPELLLPHAMRNIRVEKGTDGKFNAQVVDKDGTVRVGSAKGEPMTIKALIEEMRGSKSFARAFDGNGASGSGAGHGSEQGTPGSFRITRTDARDTRKYRAAKAAAEKAGAELEIVNE